MLLLILWNLILRPSLLLSCSEIHIKLDYFEARNLLQIILKVPKTCLFFRMIVSIYNTMWHKSALKFSELASKANTWFSIKQTSIVIILELNFFQDFLECKDILQAVYLWTWIESFICFRLTVQNVEQAGTVPAKILDPVSSEIFATHATSIEIPCVGVGLPTPEYT